MAVFGVELIASLAIAAGPGAATETALDAIEAFESKGAQGRGAPRDGPENRALIFLRDLSPGELEQALALFDVVEIKLTAVFDDGRGSGKSAAIGPFRAPNGTTLVAVLGFDKQPGEREAFLRRLSVTPSKQMTILGPLIGFDRIHLDEKSKLHFEASLLKMSQVVTIEEISRDAENNLVFRTGGEGLVGALATDMRVTPAGRVQFFNRGWFWLGWDCLGAEWQDVVVEGKPVDVPPIPIEAWPQPITQLPKWAPAPGEKKPPADTPAPDLAPVLDAIAIKTVAIEINASGGPGTLHMLEGDIDIKTARALVKTFGRFSGRTFEDDPEKRNELLVELQVSGALGTPLAGATLEDLQLKVDGRHTLRIPFDHLDHLVADADIQAELSARASKVHAALDSCTSVSMPGPIEVGLNVGGLFGLRKSGEKLSQQIQLDEDYYALEVKVSNDVALEYLNIGGGCGRKLPPVTLLKPRLDGGKLIAVQGAFGLERGYLIATLDAAFSAALRDPLDATLGTSRLAMSAGTGASGSAKLALAIRPLPRGDSEIKGVELELQVARGQVETKLAGTIEHLLHRAEQLTVRSDGALLFEAAAGGTALFPAGALTWMEALQALNAELKVEVAEGSVSLRDSTPGEQPLFVALDKGTSLHLNSGPAATLGNKKHVLSTKGWSRGELGGELNTKLRFSELSVVSPDATVEAIGPTAIDVRGRWGLGVTVAPELRLSDAVVIALDVDGRIARSARFAGGLGDPPKTFELDGPSIFGVSARVGFAQHAGARVPKRKVIELSLGEEALLWIERLAVNLGN
jgi:hypothetical protein